MHSVKKAVLSLAILMQTHMWSAAAPLRDSVLPANMVPAHPFPQHSTYKGNAILPSHLSREAMDDSVRSFYRQWKAHYILDGCNEGEKYVWFEGTK